MLRRPIGRHTHVAAGASEGRTPVTAASAARGAVRQCGSDTCGAAEPQAVARSALPDAATVVPARLQTTVPMPAEPARTSEAHSGKNGARSLRRGRRRQGASGDCSNKPCLEGKHERWRYARCCCHGRGPGQHAWRRHCRSIAVSIAACDERIAPRAVSVDNTNGFPDLTVLHGDGAWSRQNETLDACHAGRTRQTPGVTTVVLRRPREERPIPLSGTGLRVAPLRLRHCERVCRADGRGRRGSG